MTWKSLSTYAGSVLATSLVTQFLKEFWHFKKLPTRLLSFLIAVLLLTLAEIFTCGISLSRIAIIPVNAILVSLAGNGAYDALSEKKSP